MQNTITLKTTTSTAATTATKVTSKMALQPGMRVALELNGVPISETQVAQTKLALTKVGDSLVVEMPDGSAVELVDFYITDGVTLEGDMWAFSDDSALTQTAEGLVAQPVQVAQTADTGVVGSEAIAANPDIAVAVGEVVAETAPASGGIGIGGVLGGLAGLGLAAAGGGGGGAAAVVQVVADGTGVKIRVNKPSVGFQDLVTIHGATGVDLSAKTLSQLVSSGHLKLGGFSVNGASTITTTETALKAKAASPFGSVTLAAEGAVYAKGFTGGYLLASLDKTYADDVWSVAGTGISVNGSAVTVGGNVVATIDSTSNGVGTALKLTLDFSGTSLSVADQAAAVQTLAQGITYGNAGSTPTDYARAISIEVSDGVSTSKDAALLTVTPVANSETIGGVSYVTGTSAVDTLAGTAADDTFVGYGGPLANAGKTNATGDTLKGGGGHDTYLYRAGNVGKDTIADFTLGAAATANTDKLNLADLLEGYSAANIADFVRIAANGTTGVSVQVDFNGKADGSAFTPYMQVDLTGVTLASATAAYSPTSPTTLADMDALRAAMIANTQLILA